MDSHHRARPNPLTQPLRELFRPVKALARRVAPTVPRANDEPPGVSVLPGAEPYYGGDGPVGVLLCHGFTGSPRSMRPWAQSLEAAGFRVALPRLPGHGTTVEELNMTSWEDWYAVVEQEFLTLREQCTQVFVCGLSMGGSLALLLAERYGDDVSGIALVNPAVTTADRRFLALPVLRYVLKTLPGIGSDIAKPDTDEGAYALTPLGATFSMTQLWREVGAGLARVDQPLLIFRSRTDHVVDPSSSTLILASVSSTDKSEQILERSYHVATLDYEADHIFAATVTFFRRLTDE